MSGDTEFDAALERQAAEFHAQQQSATATMRSYRFAEVEPLALTLEESARAALREAGVEP